MRRAADLERIKLLAVPGKAGPVPLMNVADVTLGAGPVQLTRIESKPQHQLNVSLNGVALADALKNGRGVAVDAELAGRRAPHAHRQRTLADGDFQPVRHRDGIGVLSIYAVLVMLFHKFIQPVTILTALPPSAGGALVALLITGNGLAINSLIGLLMLMGIVSKNSILLVEYAINGAARSGPVRGSNALIDSCSKRARPIVMTTIAMVAGMMPVALGWAGDPSFRAPMGVAVIGGLIVSTVVSLFIVPSNVLGLRRFSSGCRARGARKTRKTTAPARRNPRAPRFSVAFFSCSIRGLSNGSPPAVSPRLRLAVVPLVLAARWFALPAAVNVALIARVKHDIGCHASTALLCAVRHETQETPSMAQTSKGLRKHPGSCHCGGVRFEVEIDAANGGACNCSVCTKVGAIAAS